MYACRDSSKRWVAAAVDRAGLPPNWVEDKKDSAQRETWVLTNRMPMRYPADDMAMGLQALGAHQSFFGLYIPIRFASKKKGRGHCNERERRMQFANRWKKGFGRM